MKQNETQKLHSSYSLDYKILNIYSLPHDRKLMSQEINKLKKSAKYTFMMSKN